MHDLVENGGGTVIQKWKRKQNENFGGDRLSPM